MNPPPISCPGICTNLPDLLSEIKENMIEVRVEIREMRKLCPDHSNRIRIIEDQILQARTVFWLGKGLWVITGVIVGYAIKYFVQGR